MRGKAVAMILASFLALAVRPAPAAAALPLLSPRTGDASFTGVLRAAPALVDRPVVVGDRQSLGRLALQNAGPGTALVPEAEATRGLSAVALTAVSGLSGLRPASSRLRLSDTLTLVRPAASLYSRVAELAERYRVSPIRRQPEGEVIVGQPAGKAFWPRLSIPEVRLPAQEDQTDSAYLAEVGGIRLAGRLVPPGETLPRPEEAAADPKPAVDLVATVPLVPERVDVLAHYRLVDVDRLAGAAVSSTPQTMGVGGQIALNGGTLLKAGYEVKRQGGSLASTRTDAGLSLRLDYRLSEDAALRASYTLINFGARPSPAEGRHQASAELSLRF
ncbi:MAG: hypothetical protein QME79_00445 [Bacillota bacterium]|nr:hypothetical protein [Bacillota bacterium]